MDRSLPALRPMNPTDVGTIAASVLFLGSGLLKISRQAGRIEEAVNGLRSRVDSLERERIGRG